LLAVGPRSVGLGGLLVGLGVGLLGVGLLAIGPGSVGLGGLLAWLLTEGVGRLLAARLLRGARHLLTRLGLVASPGCGLPPGAGFPAARLCAGLLGRREVIGPAVTVPVTQLARVT